jgi:hypothetical protein
MSTSPIRSGVPTLLPSPDLRPVIDALPPCTAADSGRAVRNLTHEVTAPLRYPPLNQYGSTGSNGATTEAGASKGPQRPWASEGASVVGQEGTFARALPWTLE